ncbi:hypothetical protein AB1Y20_018559 [Prymnesium parvum]|uniref:Uncharacterized protein n=1 Tax=Prymnesium parvum TaxID=97485 RepID=A0AB34JNY9_PRYPA|mmetsp:Transcript_32585/g.81108  ORF Transcript_32585/g.81108 Transcript_32585/m.81108 type:complete len:182 (+) Transcript_32585:30-575(+)
MEDFVTPAAPQYVAPSTFTYAPPNTKDDGARRPNMWGSGERADRAKYLEKMEEREFHSDKGVCSGTLLDRTTGIGAPKGEMTVSQDFLKSLAADGADKAVQDPAKGREKPSGKPTAVFSFAAEDPKAAHAWEEERTARAAQEALQAAKRKAKRDKKKAKKKAKHEGGDANVAEEAEEEDTE